MSIFSLDEEDCVSISKKKEFKSMSNLTPWQILSHFCILNLQKPDFFKIFISWNKSKFWTISAPWYAVFEEINTL